MQHSDVSLFPFFQRGVKKMIKPGSLIATAFAYASRCIFPSISSRPSLENFTRNAESFDKLHRRTTCENTRLNSTFFKS